MRKQQSGVMLLEALIAILIFSLGILGVVGMQASAVNASRDAKYRSDAGLLANELIGQMWASDRTPSVLQANFQGDGTLSGSTLVDGNGYTAWLNRVADYTDTDGVFHLGALPGAAQVPPTVTVALGAVGPQRSSSTVTINIFWRAPNEQAPHNYRVVVQII